MVRRTHGHATGARQPPGGGCGDPDLFRSWSCAAPPPPGPRIPPPRSPQEVPHVARGAPTRPAPLPSPGGALVARAARRGRHAAPQAGGQAQGGAREKAGTLKIGGDKKAAPAPPPAGGTRKASGRAAGGGRARARLQASLTPRPPPAQVTAISIFQKNAQFSSRDAGARSPPPPRVLARVQQLRLLSKLESAGILSALDRSGVTLSALEKSGALSIAESLGVLSRVADRGTPTLLYGAAAALFALGPAVAFLVPDDSTALIVAQAVVVAVAVAGGSAAFGGAALLSALQK